jgi:hypothetical protein
MSVLSTNACGRHDPHIKPQVNPRDYCQSEHPCPTHNKSLLRIISTDFSALLGRGWQHSVLVGGLVMFRSLGRMVKQITIWTSDSVGPFNEMA